MLEKMKTLLRDTDICVLATSGADGPHTSLMAYVCSEEGTEIYLVTSTNTLKYRNIASDPRVSLLVDTRDKAPHKQVQALTVTGQAHAIADAVRKGAVCLQIQRRHPHLQGLLDQPDIAFIGVRIEAFQLLSGVHEAQYVRLENAAEGA